MLRQSFPAPGSERRYSRIRFNFNGGMCNCKSAFIPGDCGHRGDAGSGGGAGASARARARLPLLRLVSVRVCGDACGGGGDRDVRRPSMSLGPEVRHRIIQGGAE